MKVKRALVIGGNGFIGSHLVDALLLAGCEVRVLDPAPMRPDVAWHKVGYRRGSLNDEATLDACLEDIDTVFHLASTTVPSTSNENPIADLTGNLLPLLSLLERMIRRNCRRIVYFSSGGTVYGNPKQLPVPESHPLEPLCPYGVVKVAAERYLLMFAAQGRLDPIILRPGNPYGPRQPAGGAQGLVAVVLDRLRRKLPIDVWGDGSVVRDYVYIDDLIRLALVAVEASPPIIINASSGQGHSIDELIGIAMEVCEANQPVVKHAGRPIDVQSLVLDVSTASSQLNWRPLVTLRDGIARTWSTAIV